MAHRRSHTAKPLFPQRAWDAPTGRPDALPAPELEGGEGNAPARDRYRRFAACALEHLPPLQRQAVQLYYFEGMKIPAIAKLLGVHRSTVSRRLAVARAALRELAQFCTGAGLLPP